MDNARELSVLFVGPERAKLIHYLTIQSQSTQGLLVPARRYYLKNSDGTEVASIDEYRRRLPGRQTRQTGDPLLNDQQIGLGYEALGVYHIRIGEANDYTSAAEYIQHIRPDAVAFAVQSTEGDYIRDYLEYTKVLKQHEKVPFVTVVHVGFDCRCADAERVKDDIVDDMKSANHDDSPYRSLIDDDSLLRPAHIFVDLESDSNYPYREYLMRAAIQNMLHTMWMLRPRVKATTGSWKTLRYTN